MKTKWLAVGIILLFLGTCVIPTIAQNTEKSQSMLKERNLDNDKVVNRLCFFYGTTEIAYEDSILQVITSIMRMFADRNNINLLQLICHYLSIYCWYKPFRIINTINVGVGRSLSYYTVGLLGIQNGSKDLHTVEGFTGVKIVVDNYEQRAVYFGFALRVIRF